MCVKFSLPFIFFLLQKGDFIEIAWIFWRWNPIGILWFFYFFIQAMGRPFGEHRASNSKLENAPGFNISSYSYVHGDFIFAVNHREINQSKSIFANRNDWREIAVCIKGVILEVIMPLKWDVDWLNKVIRHFATKRNSLESLDSPESWNTSEHHL